MRVPAVLAMVLAAAGLVSGWQAPPVSKPEMLSANDATTLTNGWAFLTEGKYDLARQRVAQVFASAPQSVHGLALAVEIEIAEKDSAAALATYERWLGQRPIDEPFVLRRVARALLFEASRAQGGTPGAKTAALSSLAADGEPAARSVLESMAFAAPGSSGSVPGTQFLAALGDPRAVGIAIDYLGKDIGGKDGLIDALVKSRSHQAVPALIQMLKDPHTDLRAIAADALGRLNATEAIPNLREAFTAPSSTFPVRMNAAGALYRLGDMTGQAQLRAWIASGPATVRVEAARMMSSRPDAEWQATVRDILSSDDPNVLVAGASLIAPYDPALASAITGRLMRDDNPVVREKAGQVLAKQLATDFRVLRALMHAADGGTRVAAATRVLELTR